MRTFESGYKTPTDFMLQEYGRLHSLNPEHALLHGFKVSGDKIEIPVATYNSLLQRFETTCGRALPPLQLPTFFALYSIELRKAADEVEGSLIHFQNMQGNGSIKSLDDLGNNTF